MVVGVLRETFQPPPLAISTAVDIVRLAFSELKQVEDGLVGRVPRIQVVRISHYAWLSVHPEPEVVVFMVLVDVGVEISDGLKGSVCGPKGQHESDFRDIDPVFLGFCPGLHQGLGGLFPDKRTVGTVKKDCVHSGISKELGVFSQHPFVRGPVVAEQRLSPETWLEFLPPGRMVVILQGFRVFPLYLADIHH